MATETERNWTAQVVIASEHGGLKPFFADLQAEIYRVLARVDDARDVMDYLKCLRRYSSEWLDDHDYWVTRK